MPKMPRILYFSSQFPSLRNPSMGVFSLNRVQALVSIGCELLVVCPVLLNPPPRMFLKPVQFLYWFKHQAQIPFSASIQGIQVYYPKWICPPRKIIGWSMSQFLYLQIRKSVSALITSFHPDVILSSWLPDGVAASKFRSKLDIPVLAIADGTDVNQWPTKYRGWEAARNILNEDISSVIFVSEALKTLGFSLGLTNKKNVVLHNAVDINLFVPGNIQRKENEYQVLGVGRLVPTKGFHVLLQAFAEFLRCANQKARLTLIGDGSQREVLRQQALQLGILPSVEFVDPIDQQKLVKYYQEADMFCLPSFNEGFPCVVVEAMACGTPVIASRVGGIAEVVDTQSGILVEPGEVSALCNALLKAMTLPWDDEIIRKKIVKDYSFEKWAETMIELIDDAL